MPPLQGEVGREAARRGPRAARRMGVYRPAPALWADPSVSCADSSPCRGAIGLVRVIRSNVRLPPRCRGGCPHPPSRRQARNGGGVRWARQPTFSQTAAQGRAGTPAPTSSPIRITKPPGDVTERLVSFIWSVGHALSAGSACKFATTASRTVSWPSHMTMSTLPSSRVSSTALSAITPWSGR